MYQQTPLTVAEEIALQAAAEKLIESITEAT